MVTLWLPRSSSNRSVHGFCQAPHLGPLKPSPPITWLQSTHHTTFSGLFARSYQYEATRCFRSPPSKLHQLEANLISTRYHKFGCPKLWVLWDRVVRYDASQKSPIIIKDSQSSVLDNSLAFILQSCGSQEICRPQPATHGIYHTHKSSVPSNENVSRPHGKHTGDLHTFHLYLAYLSTWQAMHQSARKRNLDKARGILPPTPLIGRSRCSGGVHQVKCRSLHSKIDY